MEFYGYHGVLPEETKIGQRFYVSVELIIDLHKAGQSDDLNDTVNYGEVYHLVESIVEGKPYKLVETVAEKVSSSILESYPLVTSCIVKLVKPDPPIKGHYKSVAVEIQRSR